MQGPFAEDLNVAMMKAVHAKWMVTKESGKAGGFEEKVSAAEKAGVWSHCDRTTGGRGNFTDGGNRLSGGAFRGTKKYKAV